MVCLQGSSHPDKVLLYSGTVGSSQWLLGVGTRAIVWYEVYYPYMSEFLKMDIFFFVTTVAVVVLAFFAAFVLWRLQRVLKNIEYISQQVASESDIVRQDLAEMRDDIRRGKGQLKSLFGFLKKTTQRGSKKS